MRDTRLERCMSSGNVEKIENREIDALMKKVESETWKIFAKCISKGVAVRSSFYQLAQPSCV